MRGCTSGSALQRGRSCYKMSCIENEQRAGDVETDDMATAGAEACEPASAPPEQFFPAHDRRLAEYFIVLGAAVGDENYDSSDDDESPREGEARAGVRRQSRARRSRSSVARKPGAVASKPRVLTRFPLVNHDDFALPEDQHLTLVRCDCARCRANRALAACADAAVFAALGSSAFLTTRLHDPARLAHYRTVGALF